MKRLTQKTAPNNEIKQMLKLINKLKKSQQALHNTILKNDNNVTN